MTGLSNVTREGGRGRGWDKEGVRKESAEGGEERQTECEVEVCWI